MAFGVATAAALLASDISSAHAQGVDEYERLPAFAQLQLTTIEPNSPPASIGLEVSRRRTVADDAVYARCGLDEEGFFLEGVDPDPLLRPDHIQCGLQELWADSYPDDIDRKQEQAAYLVERDGRLELIRASSTSECRSDYNPRDVPENAEIKAFIHTHPHKPFDPRPRSRECVGTRSGPMEYGHGPSGPDLTLARRMHIPNFVIEEREVFRIPPFYNNPRYGTGEHIETARRSR